MLSLQSGRSPKPYIAVCYGDHCFNLMLVSGSSVSMVDVYFADKVGLPMSPVTQRTPKPDHYAHGYAIGEVHCSFTYNDNLFDFDAIVVEHLNMNILAGCPFLEDNNIALRPARQQVIFDSGDIFQYESNPYDKSSLPFSSILPVVTRKHTELSNKANDPTIVRFGSTKSVSSCTGQCSDSSQITDPMINDISPRTM